MALRILILGKTGYGKSSLGNTLLCKKVFREQKSFGSATEKCQWSEALVHGTTVSVTDTPGLRDTRKKGEIQEGEILKEICKSVAVSCPGPHAVIIVIRSDLRFTEEEYEAVQQLIALFGKEICKYLMVVFTFGDHLSAQKEEMLSVLKEHLEEAPENLKEVLKWANDRYCIVSNKGSQEDQKYFSKTVLDAIREKVVKPNGNKYFTSEMINRCNDVVQQAITNRQTTRQISIDMATRDVKQSVIEEKEPTLLHNVMFFMVCSFVALTVGMTGGAAAGAALFGGAALGEAVGGAVGGVVGGVVGQKIIQAAPPSVKKLCSVM